MIKTLQLHQFKIFKETKEINIGKLTLLTGINGRGKSSFVQPLLLLAQSIRDSDDGTPLTLFPSGSILRLGSFTNILNSSASDNVIGISFSTDEEHDNDYSLSYHQSVDNPRFGELFSMKVNGLETFSATSLFNASDTDADTVVSPPSFSGFTPLLGLRNIFYVAADRIAPSREDDKHVSDYYLDSHGYNILHVIAKQGKNFLDTLRSQLSIIFEGATINIVKSEDSYQLMMDAYDEGKQYEAVNVGYGYSYILLLLSSILLAKKGDVIIIENPEAHLHPSAQAALMRFILKLIKEKQIQVIVETHSDHIVNGSLVGVNQNAISKDDLEIIFFEHDTNSENAPSIQNLEITEQGTVIDPPEKFCSQYDIDLETIMGF